MKRAALLLVVVGVSFAGSTTASGAVSGGGELGPDYVRATASDLGSGTFPGPGLPARSPSTVSPFTWTRSASGRVCVLLTGPVSAEVQAAIWPILGPIAVSGADVIGPGTQIGVPDGAVSLPPSLVPAGALVVGDLVYEQGAMPTLVLVVPRCITPGTPLLSNPPSAAEIWEQTPLPRTHVHASPPGTSVWPGITRLTSYFWGDRVGDAAVRVSLEGFDVAVVARPIAYAWSFGDGTTAVTADPGSAAAPVRATFLRRGDYEVRLYVVWAGHAQISFVGLPIADEDLGTVTIPERGPYHVAEVRAVLRTTPGRR